MQLNSERIIYLLEVWTNGKATEAEIDELQLWAASTPDELPVQEHIQKLVADYTEEKAQLPVVNWEQLYQHILDKRQPAAVYNFPYRKWIAAAAVLIAIASIAYFIVLPNKPGQPVAKVTAPQHIAAPGKTKATITLADGRVVYLDSAGSGEFAQQGNVQLIKLADGQIAYQTAGGEIIKELQYNTLSNPRGSKVINMQLADGSHIWLNAGSSVTYPVAFTGNERSVQINGEAYFEITADKTKPFKVSKGSMNVEVLGTHFNVNAYDDEHDIKVTLLEGSVKVSNSTDSRQIQPGQQAVIHHSSAPGLLIINNYIDTEQVMAWKNGKFSFNRADIQTVMRELARWYNIEIEYRGSMTKDLFGGDIQRNLSLDKVLDFLKQSQVHFEVAGNKVIVMP